jgi:hypothetical protein
MNFQTFFNIKSEHRKVERKIFINLSLLPKFHYAFLIVDSTNNMLMLRCEKQQEYELQGFSQHAKNRRENT